MQKITNTKERNSKKILFVEKHFNLFESYFERKYGAGIDLQKQIADEARVELGYSAKTIDFDILSGFKKNYNYVKGKIK